MDRNKLKQYAPQARRDFIAAVTDRAAYYGLTKQHIQPITEQGDVALISGMPFPRSVAEKRKRLEEHMKQQDFEQVIEAMAYTWFNRLVAIRYMEVHGYLDHGYRVLSHPEGRSTPEIVEYAEHLDLPGLDTHKIIELKLDGTKEAEVYRMLLIAQCNALHNAMPFLFERIDDETELLLPDNLLHSDSLIRNMVNSIDEEDCQEVEIIGWLYQFYISEKKDRVIGKVVKSEDILAATQLFTPNWIVKYLVQNSLGRQWMATYPNSPLKQQMEYYVEPAEQTPEVQEQLKAITPDSLNPEELTLLDPACGSGHILVEAYDLLKVIYQERGYRLRDIPRIILERNLYGLEIDDRAAQLSAFTLLMKARADDRRIFSSGIQPHVLAIQESKGLDAKEITEVLNGPLEQGEKTGQTGNISQADVANLIELFEQGKTFGSLIRVPEILAEKLRTIGERVQDVLNDGDMFAQHTAGAMKSLIKQAQVLTAKYDAIVANPPYMGGKYMNSALRALARAEYSNSKSDLFSMFAERMLQFAKPQGHMGLMTPFVWMFISSYYSLRRILVQHNCILSLIRPEYHAFFDSAYVSICAFVVLKYSINYRGIFIDLSEFYGENEQSIRALEAIHNPLCGWRYTATVSDFEAIPGNPLAYWVSNTVRNVFTTELTVGQVSYAKFGMSTGDANYTRNWFEVDFLRIGFRKKCPTAFLGDQLVWAPYDKGGAFRKWAGNWQHVIFWKNDGEDIRKSKNAAVRNPQFFCKSHVSWTLVTSSLPSFRLFGNGFLVDTASNVLYEKSGNVSLYKLLGFLNSIVSVYLLRLLNPTLNYSCGVIALLPWIDQVSNEEAVHRMVELATSDWDSFETSWDFQMSPLLLDAIRSDLIEKSSLKRNHSQLEILNEMKALEEENNHLFINAYGLKGELSPEVPEDQITLSRPDPEEDIKRLISYAIACMMGRYTLDKPGIIYAHSGNRGFDSSQYQTFPADEDGIIPITDIEWFEDDAANRLEQFIATTWPREHLEENLKFIADSLGPNRNERTRETIRRYLATVFYKHHLSMYKRRPIYWLFSSGKQRAFQCLVYLHRYNEGSLSRMRTEYLIHLQGKIASRIAQLADDIVPASSTSHRKKLERERDTLVKHQAELRTFDEKLRHYADLRISLDLDDGVKVNYGKFGDLLADVKAVTGGTEEP